MSDFAVNLAVFLLLVVQIKMLLKCAGFS